MTGMTDQAQRQQALDPTQSYLVQAPAGSGKTGLLTQRFLRLLSQVTQPEQIIALTFTRKAANEMRERILQTLIHAQQHPCPTDPHQQTSWQLATAALQRDQQAQWQLVENPNRLQIMTLDALCAKLTRQMPLLTGLGGQTDVTERPHPYYQQAAHQLITQTQPADPWYGALADLLLHVDNQAHKLEKLLANLLACRDQWLPYLLEAASHHHKRQRLEQGLQQIIDDSLAAITQALPNAIWLELEELFQFARCRSQSTTAPLFAYRDPALSPIFDHNTWVAIAHWLLTQNDQWRKQVNKTSGFPSPSDHPQHAEILRTMKTRMQQLLALLTDYPQLQQALIHCKHCPPAHYSEPQWQMVDALITLLPILCAELKLVFQQTGQVDFIEIAAGATQALGALDDPSELALRLDVQIQHLLIDEFQDTSIHQFRLLEQLTLGWQADEGRTLFLVGDPMQSIYRFRAAEVGLFLHAKANGVGQVPLQFIQLQTNFRSQPALIEWVNQTFAQAFPKQSMMEVGAIHYSCASAAQSTPFTPAVTYYASEQRIEQAAYLVELIQTIQHQQPEASIAILVQSRNHLTDILPALRKAHILYHGVELDRLNGRSVIIDLRTLTRSLLLPQDRLAWLSLLRTPWCGLDLADLLVIANLSSTDCVFAVLQNDEPWALLSASGVKRVQRLIAVMNRAIEQRQRQPLADWIRTTWQALGGFACLTQADQFEDAQTFFDLLMRLDAGGDLNDLNQFDLELNALFAASTTTVDAQVHIMTMHKAKGLEFDVVILPNLDQGTANNPSALLLWAERARAQGSSDLILAPIKASDTQADPIVDYLKYQEKCKQAYETTRLLYVAATRAKQQLHLMANLTLDEQGHVKSPPTASLLHPIWPTVEPFFTQAWSEKSTTVNRPTHTVSSPIHRRLPLTATDSTMNWPAFTKEHSPSTLPHQLLQPARYVGTVIHEQLLALAKHPLRIDQLPARLPAWRTRLQILGVPNAAIEPGLQTILQALTTCLQDPKGQWILADHHQSIANEYALTGWLRGNYRSIVIDRTFIDDQGIRWIIDYKTVEELPVDLNDFLQQQRRQHQPQLDTYAAIMAGLDSVAHTIQCALYFPQFAGWVAWESVPNEQ